MKNEPQKVPLIVAIAVMGLILLMLIPMLIIAGAFAFSMLMPGAGTGATGSPQSVVSSESASESRGGYMSEGTPEKYASDIVNAAIQQHGKQFPHGPPPAQEEINQLYAAALAQYHKQNASEAPIQTPPAPATTATIQLPTGEDRTVIYTEDGIITDMTPQEMLSTHR